MSVACVETDFLGSIGERRARLHSRSRGVAEPIAKRFGALPYSAVVSMIVAALAAATSTPERARPAIGAGSTAWNPSALD